SGANVNFDRLRHIAERAEIGEQREALLAVTVPERPGSFRKFCRTIGRRSVTEFNYRYADENQAHVFAGLELRHGDAERRQIIEKLEAAGYPVLDLTFNEMAKLHIRYMVGGHVAGKVDDELLYRVEFPERPGALLDFLTRMGRNWNISLFHYRNHGSAVGRVLVGTQVPADERKEFQAFLDSLGYSYYSENDNPAYQAFLA
ncbi:MAG: threonine ammonia-lyase, biosynthetic, partial [Gammaproteobacteria bacterium]|nr:threonine ammonia-lyase, biosynthetic [Gammaproteobacteria bacterium]